MWYKEEMQMKKYNLIQWFVTLIHREMKEYEEDVGKKQKILDNIMNEISKPPNNTKGTG